MSLGQVIAAIDGWNRVHGPQEKPEPMSDDKFDRMLEALGEQESG